MDPNRSPDPTDDTAAQQWRDVYQKCEGGLRSFLRSRLNQVADVDDCLQAVYVKMIQNQTDIPSGARRAWLFRVASNEAALLWRRRTTTKRVLEQKANDLDLPNSQSSSLHNLASQTSESQTSESRRNTVDRLIQDETADRARQIIATLPATTQQIIQLRLVHDRTFQEIADQLNIPLGTALTRMRRALEKIKSEIDDENDDETKQ